MGYDRFVIGWMHLCLNIIWCAFERSDLVQWTGEIRTSILGDLADRIVITVFVVVLIWSDPHHRDIGSPGLLQGIDHLWIIGVDRVHIARSIRGTTRKDDVFTRNIAVFDGLLNHIVDLGRVLTAFGIAGIAERITDADCKTV